MGGRGCGLFGGGATDVFVLDDRLGQPGPRENSSTWGDIERWNHDPLKACIDANTSTCNFHIKVPEK